MVRAQQDRHTAAQPKGAAAPRCALRTIHRTELGDLVLQSKSPLTHSGMLKASISSSGMIIPALSMYMESGEDQMVLSPAERPFLPPSCLADPSHPSGLSLDLTASRKSSLPVHPLQAQDC